MKITLPGKQGPIELEEETIASLRKVWPTKDVDTELAKMHLWCLANPKRRPGYVFTFIKNWMKKAPDVTPPAAPAGAGWWKSPEATLELGQSLAIPARPGEEMSQYRERLTKALQHKREH